jgi:ketosteroid isomerase-like protein
MKQSFSTVEEVLENYKTSVSERDVEKFLRSYSENISLYDCWNKWECNGLSDWRKSVESWFQELSEESLNLKVTFSDMSIEEGESVAFAKCAITYAAYVQSSSEILRQITNRFTFGLCKVDGSWQIVHEHSSLPIDPATGKGMFHLK